MKIRLSIEITYTQQGLQSFIYKISIYISLRLHMKVNLFHEHNVTFMFSSARSLSPQNFSCNLMNIKRILKAGFMSPEAIRKFWSLIEETQTNILLTLDNDALVNWLSRQLRREEFLKMVDTSDLNAYISARLPLIRDLAQERLAYQSHSSG